MSLTGQAVVFGEFPLPSSISNPFTITRGPDGNLWFTEFYNNKIGRITPSGTVSEFPIPTASSGAYGITQGSDGNLWFTENNSNKIGRITTAGVVTEFPAGSTTHPLLIAAGSDGALWFTESQAHPAKIGRMTTAGVFTEFPVLSVNMQLGGITAGPDGALWFTEYTNSGTVPDQIGRITTAGVVSEFPMSSGDTQPIGITAGPDGALWFAENTGNKIGRITTSGTITEFTPPTPNSGPAFITAGPDGALWFTEIGGNSIGRITTSGSFSEYPLPSSNGGAYGITLGPDNALWFVEFTGGKVGRVQIAAANSPGLLASKSHPTDFVQGERSATYTIAVLNPAGAAAASGAVTVTDNLPAGLSLVSMAGTGWTCVANTCNRADGLPAGSSYPPIGVTVDVSSGAASPLVNTVTLSGGGSASETVSDSTLVDAVAPGGVTEFPVSAGTFLYSITAGPDGALWFTEAGIGKIGKMTTTGSITEFPLPTGGFAYGITSGPDGALWFTDAGTNQIGRITTGGTVNEFPVTPGAVPYAIVAGPDGNLWFTEEGAGKIGRITVNGSVTEFSITTPNSQPLGIVAGPDGALWFNEATGKIGRISTTGQITEFTAAIGFGSGSLASGPDGALWFTDARGIGRMTTSGSISIFPIPTPNGFPGYITAGPDGALWFTESSANKIGRITTSGSVAEFVIPSGALGSVITAGPDQAVWFTEQSGNKIGRIGVSTASALGISKSHTGSFSQGQQGAAYTVTVFNAPQALASSGTVTVSENVPAGLTLVSMSGAGWSCAGSSCARNDSLQPGASYPPITVTVNVAGNAPASVTNVATVTSGSASSNTSDITSISQTGTVTIVPSCSTLRFFYANGDPAPHGQTCFLTITPASVTVTATASTQTGGSWLSASTNGPTLNVDVSSGLAPGIYAGTVTLSAPGATAAVVNVQLTVSTGLSISPTSDSIGAAGGVQSTTVSLNPATSTATWKAVSNVPWISFASPVNGQGSGSGVSINYHVAANNAGPRTGTFTVLNSDGFAAATFTVNQAGLTCDSLTASPSNITFSSGTGSGTVQFNLSGCPVTPVSNVPWLVLGTPAADSLPFTVQANPGALRTGTITINGSLVVNVTQTGLICSYSIATHAGSSPTYSSAGGTGVIDVSAPSGCPAPTATASDPFITITGITPATAAGAPATASYTVSATTAARNGSIAVSGLVYKITQSAAGQSFTCTAVSGQVNLRKESASEQLGDMSISCTGQAPAGATADFIITLNTTVSNHLVALDPSNQTTDAVMLKDFNKNTPLVLGTNVFLGLIAGPNAIRFHAVPLTNGGFGMRITNIRADASSGGSTVTATLKAVGAVPITLPGPQDLGLVAQGVTSSQPASSSAGVTGATFRPLVFTELQTNAFRSIAHENAHGFQDAVLGADAGALTNATRLLAVVSGVPAGVNLYAPLAPTVGNRAQLMSSDLNGVGGFPEQGSVTIRGTRFASYQPIVLTGSAGTATWEIIDDDPNSAENLTFNLLIDNPSNASLSGMTITLLLGPQVANRSTSADAPVPRFVRSGLPQGSCTPGATPPGISCLGVSPSLPSLGLGQPAAAPFRNAARSNAVRLAGPGRFDDLRLPLPLVLSNESATDTSSNVNLNVGTDTPNITIIGCASTDPATCTGGGNSINMNYDRLSPGESPIIVIYASALSTNYPANGLVQFHGTVSGANGNRDSNGAFVTDVRIPALSVIQSNAPLLPGQNNTVAVTVGNAAGAGDLPPGLIQIQYQLPVGVSPGNITGTNWTCNTQDRQNPTCTYGPQLRGGQTADPLNVTFFINAVNPPAVLSYKARLLLLGGFELTIHSLDTASTTIQTTPTGLQFTLDGGAARTAPQTLYLTQADHTLAVASPQTLSGVQYTFSRWNDNSTAASRTITVASAAATYTATFTSPNSCSFSTNSTAVSVPSGSGTTGSSVTGTLTLTATACTAANTWTAVSDSPRLQVSPASGNGATAQATISYTMLTNSTTAQRVAHITVAGIQVTLTQAGSSETPGQRVVRALYQTILGREPDSGGWTFWTGPGAPTNPGGAVLYNQMADGFYVSPEFKNSGWLVLNIYQAMTGGLPTFGPWLSAVTRIRNQSLTPAQLTDTLAGTVSNTQFINSAFQNCFGRGPLGSEFSTALANLNAGQSKFDFLNSTIFAANEFAGRTNGMLVQALYYTILVRDVDNGGFNFWLSQLDPPNGQAGIYYLYNPQPVTQAYTFKLAVIGQAVPPNPNLLGFLGSPEFQSLIR